MLMLEKAKEKELMMGKHKGIGVRLLQERFEMKQTNCKEYRPYKLYPVLLDPLPSIRGSRSKEMAVQAHRERSTMAAFFHPDM